MFDTEAMVAVRCYKCNILFHVPERWNTERKEDHSSFWCPVGHEQHYTGQNTKEKLAQKEQELANLRRELYVARDDRDKIQKKLARQAKRIHAGVCPKCNRTFENVARHMESKHS